MIMNTFIVFIIFIMSCGCAFADGPWKGKILDIETKEPLEGVVVLAVWDRIYRTPYGTNSYFYEAKETLTNKAGEFVITSYTPINLLPIVSYMQGPEFTIYKPGYGSLQMALGDYLTNDPKKQEEFELSKIKYRLSSRIIELPPLKTWEERNKANMISPYGDIPKHKWPLLNATIEYEEKWLVKNKDWRK
jgi:hypothetical protein